MTDYLGRIPVPALDAGVQTPDNTFPLTSDWGAGVQIKRNIVTHTFGTLDAKITQRFYTGNGAVRYLFRSSSLTTREARALAAFWETMGGPTQPFYYKIPQEDGTTVTRVVVFENAPLSLQQLTNTICSVGVTMVDVTPGDTPSYDITETVLRYPSSALATNLLNQIQEIIPLVVIKTLDDQTIYLSDRRVTVGGNTYLPRVLRLGEQGSEAIMTQTDDGSEDTLSLTFGNADRVMIKLANDTQLLNSRVELSLFRVDSAGAGTLLNLWAGYIVDWSCDKGGEFSLRCSDILAVLTRTNPVNNVARTCWRRYGQDGCPGGAIDLVHFPDAGVVSWRKDADGNNIPRTEWCDGGYNTPNGCMAHSTTPRYFGATFGVPQSAIIDVSRFGTKLQTRASIISDTVFGKTVPEIWTHDDNVPQFGLPVPCRIIAGRDEQDFYIALGIVGKGPLGGFTSPQMYDSNFDGKKDRFVGSTLDGMMNHGYQVDQNGNLKTGKQPSYGLRQGLGTDPAGVNDYFSLGRVCGSGAPAKGWYLKSTDGYMYEVELTGSAYDRVYGAGLAFCEIRISKSKSEPFSRPDEHQMLAVVSKGLTGYVWSGGVRSTQVGCTNPFWVALNTFLRSLALQDADAATHEQYFDVTAAQDCAAVADLVVPKVIGSGNEVQFRFKGIIDDRRPTRDWLMAIMSCCLGGFVWSFGKLKFFVRCNASSVAAFTSGNTILNSLSMAPLKPTYEKLTITFNDQDYFFQNNSVEYTDQDYAARNKRIQNPLSRSLAMPQCPTKSQAGRISTTRTREELGGVNKAEQDVAKVLSLKTTIAALDTEAGMVVSVYDDDLSGGLSEIRIKRWTLNRDWSVTIQGQTVTDGMYDLAIGPKPADVGPGDLPVRKSAVWNPNYALPVAGDPLWTDPSFGCAVEYESGSNGLLIPRMKLYGESPADDRNLYFKIRREFIGGIWGAQVATVGVNTLNFGLTNTTDPGFVGRVLTKVSNPPDDETEVAYLDFVVTAYNTTTGDMTVTPDPFSLGCKSLDVFVMRTGYAQSWIDEGHTPSSPLTAGADWVKDDCWFNPYNPSGLMPDANIGDVLLVIAGKGAGQTPQVVTGCPDGKTISVHPGWDQDCTPDATSVIVVVEAVPQVKGEIDCSNTGVKGFLGSFSMPSYATCLVRVEGYYADAVLSPELVPFREIYAHGPQGTREIIGSATMMPTDANVLALAELGDIVYTCLSFSQVPRQTFTVTKTDNSTNKVTIVTQAGDEFADGTTSVELTKQGDSFTFRVEG